MYYPILPMLPDLWPAVREIYREGIETGNATFETEVPDWEKWDTSHRKNCRLVALEALEEAVGEGLRSARFRGAESTRVLLRFLFMSRTPLVGEELARLCSER